MELVKKLSAFALVSALLFAVPGVAAARGPEVNVEVLTEGDGVHAGEGIRVAVRVRLNEGWHVNSREPLEDFLIPTVLSLDAPEGVSIGEIVYPEALLLVTGGLDEPLAVYESKFVIGVALALDDDVPSGEMKMGGTLRYQACDDKQCFAPKTVDIELVLNVVPAGSEVTLRHGELFDGIAFSDSGETPGPSAVVPDGSPAADPAGVPAQDGVAVLALLDEFQILGTAGGYLKKDKFIAFVDGAESGVVARGLFEGKGPIAILALILVGGLALNLTPCVLPMIPINLAIIGAGAQAGSRVRGFALGGAYGAAMAFVYGVLGLVVILTAGTFGVINASPWFNLGIAVLFVALTLAMFDVIAIDFSRFQSKLNLGQKGKGTFLLAFGMGSVAALLAGACVAPVVIQVIVFSSDLYAKGAKLALALPFFLGLGMALPWPVAGAGLSFMPKPGPWMVRVKQVFGVFILAFAAYYGYQSYELFSDRWVDRAEVAGSVEEMLEEGWVPSLSQGLEMAKAENKLVLIDLWATWCKNCLTMDKTTFKDPEVLARLDGYVKVKFQAQDPDASPVKEVMDRFGSIGLPTYAILQVKSDT